MGREDMGSVSVNCENENENENVLFREKVE